MKLLDLILFIQRNNLFAEGAISLKYIKWGFMQGMGSVVDLGGFSVTTPKISKMTITPHHGFVEDSKMLANDWRIVGEDLREAATTLGMDKKKKFG